MDIPHNLDLERAVLGALLVDAGAIDEVRDVLAERDFYRLAYQRTWSAVCALGARGETVHPFAVSQALASTGHADAMSVAQIAALADGIPRRFDLRDAADRLIDLTERRTLQALCSDVAGSLATTDGAASAAHELIDGATAIVEARAVARGQTLGDVLDATVPQLDEPTHALPTGFEGLDRQGCGLTPGELVLLAARPSVGKTSFALTVALAVARSGVPVVFFSLEMAARVMALRWLAVEAEADLSRLMHRDDAHAIDDATFERIRGASDALHAVPLRLIDAPAIGLADVRRAARAHPGALVVVDYLGLLRPPAWARDYGNRVQEVGALSRGLKAVAHDAGVAVLALSQLSRAPEQRTDKIPQLSDLRDSGSLEQDADQVWLLYRHAVHDEAAAAGDAIVKVGKNRNGPTPTIELMWQPERAAFRQRQLGDGLRVEASAARKVAASFG